MLALHLDSLGLSFSPATHPLSDFTWITLASCSFQSAKQI